MNIKVDKVWLNNGTSKNKGTVVFIVDDTVKVRGSVIEGANGLFVALPRSSYKDKKTGEEKFVNEVEFTKTASQEVQKVLLNAFKTEQLGGKSTGSTTTTSPKPATTGTDIPF